MKRHHRDPVIRIASKIHEQLLARTSSHDSPSHDPLNNAIESLLTHHRFLEHTQRRIHLCRQHGLHLAAQCLVATLPEQLYSLRRLTIDLAARAVDSAGQSPTQSPAQSPSLSMLVLDLRQLHQEFEQVKLDPKLALISVITEPITLEGLQLGRFEIQLHISQLTHAIDSSVFTCVALDPNPAAVSESTTHPHVRDEGLCAGEAAAAIANALKDGRITDAFQLVNSVLHTYNPQSPFVALDDWDGVRCKGCNDVMDRDDACYCESCDNDFCDNCISRCDECDLSCCSDCLERDRVSDNLCCSACRHTCQECDRIVDDQSFVQATGLCPGCEQARQLAEAESQAPESIPPESVPPESTTPNPEHDHEPSKPAPALATA